MTKASTATQNRLHTTANTLKWANEPSNPSNCMTALIANRTMLTMRAHPLSFHIPNPTRALTPPTMMMNTPARGAESSKNTGCPRTALALLAEHRGYEAASQNHANSTQETNSGPDKVENRKNRNAHRSTHTHSSSLSCLLPRILLTLCCNPAWKFCQNPGMQIAGTEITPAISAIPNRQTQQKEHTCF